MALPTAKTVDEIEAQITGFVHSESPNMRLGASGNIERARNTLTNGITNAYESGQKALEAALSAADEQVRRHEQQVANERKGLDELKDKISSYLLEFKSRNSNLTADMDAHLEHMGSMARSVDEHREKLKRPRLEAPKSE